MLVAQYNVGDNVNVDGRDAIITKVDTESWVTVVFNLTIGFGWSAMEVGNFTQKRTSTRVSCFLLS